MIAAVNTVVITTMDDASAPSPSKIIAALQNALPQASITQQVSLFFALISVESQPRVVLKIQSLVTTHYVCNFK